MYKPSRPSRFHIVDPSKDPPVAVCWTDAERTERFARKIGFSVCEIVYEPTPTVSWNLRRGLGFVAALACALALVGCGGKVSDDLQLVPVIAAALLPLDGYAQAICDRAASCGPEFHIAPDDVGTSEDDPDCAEHLAAWMRAHETTPGTPDACYRAMSERVQEQGCTPSAGVPAACSGGVK